MLHDDIQKTICVLTYLFLLSTFSVSCVTGYAFAFGGQNDTDKTTFLGTKDFASVGESPAFWFFQYTFSATSVTIVAGTLAERCQMAGTLFQCLCCRLHAPASLRTHLFCQINTMQPTCATLSSLLALSTPLWPTLSGPTMVS